MNPVFRKSLPARLCLAAIVAAPLLVPVASQAQYDNTATGVYALPHDTTGSENTADGFGTLYLNTTGSNNTAVGNSSLYSNTTGSSNTATGVYALLANTTGYDNTASGYDALYANTWGYYNTATGSWTLCCNTTGVGNTANGISALYTNATGSDNTATGSWSLYYNTTGTANTASGVSALFANTTGIFNTAIGGYALSSNTKGGYNIAVGYGAGQNNTTGSNNIEIGNSGASTDTGDIRIGTAGSQTATFLAGIYGTTVSGVEVFVNANGQLGTFTSSRRYKNDIKDMGDVSAKLMQLRPVTFRYKDSAEKGPHALQYGLIAEEVAKVYPDLVQFDKQGRPYTVNYHLLTPMLLNELQKEQRRLVAQKTELTAMKAIHNAEITALKTAFQTQSAELTSLQQQQLKVLAKLAAFVPTSRPGVSSQKAVFVLH
jgi:hypothetical protein